MRHNYTDIHILKKYLDKNTILQTFKHLYTQKQLQTQKLNSAQLHTPKINLN